ncbi:MAG: hypothetical protein K2H23_06120 [Oscillospiraceae bacterium]|nr:hypothetical protein [Oscillospiraceae bacterium]
MMAANKVIAGFHEGESVRTGNGLVLIGNDAAAKWTVEDYELVSGEKSVSLASGLLRGVAGRLILGPWGMLAALTAKKNGVYVVALQWKNGKKSLLELDEKVYKALLKSIF